MGRKTFCTLVVLALAGAAGCRGTAMPNWWYPGPAEYQQDQAEQFDPYPEPDTGPAVEGGRPMGYETPVAEPSRARWNPRTWVRRFGY